MTPLWQRFAFWAMLPLTALQGLWLRRKALRLPGAEGERRGVTGAGRDFHLLAIGDSIIDGVGPGRIEHALPVQFASALAESGGLRVHWRVDGLSGRVIQDVIEALADPGHDAPVDLVLVSVGVNDVTGLCSTRRWRRGVVDLLDGVSARWPGAGILFCGLPPMARFPLPPQPLRYALGLRAATLDRIAAEILAGQAGASHVPTRIDPLHHDFCEDGFHPSADSCTLWARQLAAVKPRNTTG